MNPHAPLIALPIPSHAGTMISFHSQETTVPITSIAVSIPEKIGDRIPQATSTDLPIPSKAAAVTSSHTQVITGASTFLITFAHHFSNGCRTPSHAVSTGLLTS